MSIRQVATGSRWVAGAMALALGSFATAQVQEAAPRALAFTVIHDFAGATLDGDTPLASLTPTGDGSYYGTTAYGGNVLSCVTFSPGCGTVFKLTPNGSETVVYNFTGGAGGSVPGPLITDALGNLYGTTGFDGDLNCNSGSGCGVIFKLTPDGTDTVLHTFSAVDGGASASRLVRDAQGNLYGTTAVGGNQGCSGKGCGVVFKLAPDGTYTQLHIFAGGSDGARPNPNLIRDRAGNLYGTTQSGGSDNNGLVFKVQPNGKNTILYAFRGGADGQAPAGGLVRDRDGNLYGTTNVGGLNLCPETVSCGVVFKLAPDGTETVLYSFKGGSDGANPLSTLYRNPKTGALYGTTWLGGINDLGTVFVVKPDDSEQVLHSFAGSDGAYPNVGASLVRGGGARLIGTTPNGGADDHGVIYSLQISQ